eukprot:Phypoly_transcript_13625.p1 GENE.Phypoly_transcript_13625~~Phypoly_transcript_13625.p1  ORF type:complete len:309 (-),score=55.49 Phypoly_transcript_13625:9-935(-)
MYQPPPDPNYQPQYIQPAPIVYAAPVVVQPVMVSPPMGDPLIDGLSYFPALVVKQKVNSFWEYLCNCEEENKYTIFNPMGESKEKILVAKEKSGYCTRMCLAEKRHFHMAIKTNEDQEALYFERPYRLMERGGWCCCCSKCGFQALRVYGGADAKAAEQLLAYVQEDYYMFFPVLSVYDENSTLQFRIKMKGNCQNLCCGWAKATFEIFDANDLECHKHVGKIKKKWSGSLKEIFTDADNFFIEFPPAATARQRAGLLGALFFIDYLYYEDGGCHFLHYLGAPLAGPCACMGWCGSCLECLCESALDN